MGYGTIGTLVFYENRGSNKEFGAQDEGRHGKDGRHIAFASTVHITSTQIDILKVAAFLLVILSGRLYGSSGVNRVSRAILAKKIIKLHISERTANSHKKRAPYTCFTYFFPEFRALYSTRSFIKQVALTQRSMRICILS